MFIKEACVRSKLTKKAIEYYELQGLVHPVVKENGYREFSMDDIVILKEIAILRTLGVCVKDIQAILHSSNKSVILEQCIFDKQLQLQREQEQQKWLKTLQKDYNIEAMFDDIMIDVDGYYSIQERLSQAFPGILGMYLSWHFGSFLTDTIKTSTQREAYETIIDWLDNVLELQIPEELQGLMERNLEVMQQGRIAVLESVLDINAYMGNNKEQIELYVFYTNSEEYRNSPVYQLKTLLEDFQKRSGYVEVFIKNMRVLSRTYGEYMKSLEQANEVLLRQYPSMRKDDN